MARVEKTIIVSSAKDETFIFETDTHVDGTDRGKKQATAIYGEGKINFTIGKHSFTTEAPMLNAEVGFGLGSGFDWASIINEMQAVIVDNKIKIGFPFKIYAS